MTDRTNSAAPTAEEQPQVEQTDELDTLYGPKETPAEAAREWIGMLHPCDFETMKEAAIECDTNYRIARRERDAAIHSNRDLEDVISAKRQHLAEKDAKIAELEALLNTPETDDFFKGIELEAAHQRFRWPSENDAGKTPADWFWLVGYLAGKCLHAAIAGDTHKALHHTISTAAALANWHRAIKGAGNMRPGIATPVGIETEV